MSKASDIYSAFMHYIDRMNEQPGLHHALCTIQPDSREGQVVSEESKNNFNIGMSLAHTTCIVTGLDLMPNGPEKDKLKKIILDSIEQQEPKYINNWYEAEEAGGIQ